MAETVVARRERICEFVKAMVRHCERVTSKDRERFNKANQMFNGIQDFGDDIDKTSINKVFLYIFAKIVRGAAADFQDMIVQSGDFIGLEAPSDEDPTVFFQSLEKIFKYRIKELDFEQFIYEFSIWGGMMGLGVCKLSPEWKPVFKPEYVTKEIEEQEAKQRERQAKDIEQSGTAFDLTEAGVEAGVEGALDELLGAPKKKKVRVVEPKRKLELRYKLKAVDPRLYFFDPKVSDANDSFWNAEVFYSSMPELEEFFDSGLLRPGAKEELIESLGAVKRSGGVSEWMTESQYGYVVQDQADWFNEYVKPVEVCVYYGPLLDKDTNKRVKEDRWYIIANGKVLLFEGKNPSWKKYFPYYSTRFSITPAKALGAGIADGALDQNELMNVFLSLFLDYLMFAVLGVKAGNIDDLDNPEDLQGGFRPGMFVPLNTTKKAQDVFTDLTNNANLTFPVLQMLQYLDLSAEAGSSVDTSNANPSSRARISAAEIQANTTRSLKSTAVIGRQMDRSLIQETAQRVLDMVLQYDLKSEQLQVMFEKGVVSQSEFELLKDLSPEERFNEANRGYRIRIRGLKEQIDKQDFLQRLTEGITVLNQIPESRDKVDWSETIEIIAQAFNMPSERMVRQETPQDQAQEENFIMKGERFVQVLPDDPHDIHLLKHYEGLLSGPTEAGIQHTLAHIQAARSGGVGFPEPPEELLSLLGLDQQEESEGQTVQ